MDWCKRIVWDGELFFESLKQELQWMVDDLIEIKELFELLGYTEQRSLQNWCKKNKIPLIQIGKKTYTVRYFIDKFILEKLDLFLKANYGNADEMLRAIKQNDMKLFSETIKASEIRNPHTKKPIKDSKAAEDFMKKLRHLN